MHKDPIESRLPYELILLYKLLNECNSEREEGTIKAFQACNSLKEELDMALAMNRLEDIRCLYPEDIRAESMLVGYYCATLQKEAVWDSLTGEPFINYGKYRPG